MRWKEPGPEGGGGARPLAALLLGHVGLGYAPSSRPAAAGPLDPRRLNRTPDITATAH